jgi:hypothetical protein
MLTRTLTLLLPRATAQGNSERLGIAGWQDTHGRTGINKELEQACGCGAREECLGGKNFTLSYEKKASEQMVTMMRQRIKEDRQDFFTQMDKLVKDMGDTKQLVGALQTLLKQIGAPKPPGQSAATTGWRQITEAGVIDKAQHTHHSDMPLPCQSSDTLTAKCHRPVNLLTL